MAPYLTAAAITGTLVACAAFFAAGRRYEATRAFERGYWAHWDELVAQVRGRKP